MVLIAVHGIASRFLPAERGTVHLSIEFEHEDRATAVQQAAMLHGRFIAEATAWVESGAATWWGSAQVWVRAEHRHEGAAQTLRTLQLASAGVQVRFQDFAALSTWILEAGSVPGVSVDQVVWEVTRAHRAAAERALRVEAVGDAIERAEAYASAIGGGGVALQAVWEEGLRPSESQQQPRWGAQRLSNRTDDGFDLRPGDIEIGASVTADFAVETPS